MAITLRIAINYTLKKDELKSWGKGLGVISDVVPKYVILMPCQ